MNLLDGELCPAGVVIDLDADDADPPEPVPAAAAPNFAATEPTDAERERLKVKLLHFHKAAGHCSGRHLARIVRDAKMEPWKIKMAMDF